MKGEIYVVGVYMSVSVVAHRGNCLDEIENTFESVKSAIDKGVNFIEIDIQFTQDNVPVVFHDANWLRMTGKKGLVAKTRTADVKNYKITSYIKNKGRQKSVGVALLADLLPLLKKHQEVTLFVEVKAEIFLSCSYQKCLQVLNTTLQSVMKQVVIISFSYRFLRYCQKQSLSNIGYVLPRWENYSSKMLKQLSPAFIFCDIDIFPKDFTHNRKDITWVLYECKSTHDPYIFVKQGVTHLETYYPTLLAKRVEGIL